MNWKKLLNEKRIRKSTRVNQSQIKNEGIMARVTIEDCLTNVENMYELVHLATKRARQRNSDYWRTDLL